MKLSELTYSYLQSVGLGRAYIHTDRTDCLRQFDCKSQFECAKADLMRLYGDVTIEVNPDAIWYDRIKIVDSNWQTDHDGFCRMKAAWCKQYGSD